MHWACDVTVIKLYMCLCPTHLEIELYCELGVMFDTSAGFG